MLGRLGLFALASVTLASCSGESSQLRVTGSATIYPFTKAVAEAFVKGQDGRKAPMIDNSGTGPGIVAFCSAAGSDSPDIADASRRMRRAEFDKCQANGVREIIEAPIGLDGVALAESNEGPKLTLTRKDIYLALAANPMGKPNTAKTWKDVNPSLPAIPIQVLGPPATSGTRDAFLQLMLQPGCLEAMPEAKDLQAAGDPAAFDKACHQIRADGPYVVEGEDGNVIVKGMKRNANALGLFGYSFLEQNAARLHGVPIDGIAPDVDAIASGKYPGMRTLYLYIKKTHVDGKPALKSYLDQYVAMWAPDGALSKLGLIPLSDKARTRSAEAINLMLPMDPGALL